MDWNQIIQQVQAQDSIIWLAAFSVALGATLLLVSGMILARKRLSRGIPAAWFARQAAPAATKSPLVKATETGYQAIQPGLKPLAAAKPGSGSRHLDDLRSRLKVAANSLEDLHQSLKNDDQVVGISSLKNSARDVDYVFKAGVS